ncbi:hypothetical protein F5Y16DRAFT_415564 [Xylariaceae sp. FL0255]|nr:hypothetical protein F5Y16DRAFT_415564 [Xylariaceae sp. FL0255]
MADAGLSADGDSYGSGGLDSVAGKFQQRAKTNKERRRKALVFRFAVALFSGVALIAPMLIMVLHQGIPTALATTSVAVFILAIVVALYSNAGAEAIMGTVAAYAAVLIVFVGNFVGNLNKQ